MEQLEWAARAKLVKEGDNWKMDFYRVYMVGGVSPWNILQFEITVHRIRPQRGEDTCFLSAAYLPGGYSQSGILP